MSRVLSASTKAKISQSLKGNKNAFTGGPQVRQKLSTRQKVANINASTKNKGSVLTSDQMARRRAVAQRLRGVARKEESAGINPAHSTPIPKPNGPDPKDSKGAEIRARGKGKLAATTAKKDNGPSYVEDPAFTASLNAQAPKAAGQRKRSAGDSAKYQRGDGAAGAMARAAKTNTAANSNVSKNSFPAGSGKTRDTARQAALLNTIQKRSPATGRANNTSKTTGPSAADLATNFYQMHGLAGVSKKVAQLSNRSRLSKKDKELLGELRKVNSPTTSGRTVNHPDATVKASTARPLKQNTGTPAMKGNGPSSRTSSPGKPVFKESQPVPMVGESKSQYKIRLGGWIARRDNFGR